MICFTTGFATVARILLLIAGGISAILVAAMAVTVLLAIGAWVFDRVTTAMVQRWRRLEKQPRGRLAAILMAHMDDA